MGGNYRDRAIEKIRGMLQAGFHGVKSKERLEDMISLLSSNNFAGDEAVLINKIAKDFLAIFERGIEHKNNLNKFIDEGDWLDNGVTKYKNFRRKILKGDTPEECLASVKSWLELFDQNNIAMQVVSEVDKILSMDAEDVYALSRKHRLNFPESKEKLVCLFNEFRARDFKNDPDHLTVFLFLIDLISKYTKVNFFGHGIVESMHQYFNALELVRLAEEEIANNNDFSKLAKLFFELGCVYEEFLSYARQSDIRIVETMDSRRAANVCRSQHVESDKSKEFDKLLLEFAEPAWDLRCKLLHTQMAVVLHMGVLSGKPDKDKVAEMAEELTRIPIALKEGKDERVQGYCPCDELKDICVIGKLLQKKKKAYLLKFAHKQNKKDLLKSWQFKSIAEVKDALLKNRSS